MTPRSRVRLAVILWITLGIIVWNVVFDHVVDDATHRFVLDTTFAYRAGEPFLLIKDYMPAAVHRGVWLGTVAGGSVVAVGLIAIAALRWRETRRGRS
ncbi:MAG: hypothetical protein LBQ09_06735 [Acidobacteriaceae bacterium]|jgi:hypothetical protein|nr:hypothetical protein [Acidobacteriaceae bacterium]